MKQVSTLKILFLSPWCPQPADNGEKLRIFHLIEQLSSSHDVTLLTFTWRDTDRPDSPELARVCRSVHAVAANPFPASLGLRGLMGSAPRGYAQTFSADMARLVRGQAAGHDVVILNGLATSLYLGEAAGTPVVLEDIEMGFEHEALTREKWAPARFRRWLTWRKLGGYVRGLTRAAAATTVVSDMARDHLLSVGCEPDRVVVVPNGVPARDLTIGGTRDPSTLVYHGSVTYEPNLEAVRYFTREIWPIVRRSRPDARLSITGTTTGVPLADLESVPGVTFTGWLPDVRTLVASSGVCIVPLRTGAGTRLKILEAMALGTPVVSTTKGVEGLRVTDGSHLLLADSPEAFADCVVRVMQDTDLATRLSRNARALVEREYTWEAIAPRLEALLKAITEAAPHPRLDRAHPVPH